MQLNWKGRADGNLLAKCQLYQYNFLMNSFFNKRTMDKKIKTR